MKNLHKITLVVSVATTGCSAAAWAQAPPSAAPDAAAPATADAPVIESNAAVRAALEIPREEPADFFQAITWLIELDRPELAKPILDELAKLQLSDAQRAALVEEFGSRSMLQLARANELAPTGAEFADACMKATAAATSDPQRIAALVAQLSDPSAEVRVMARNDLAATGRTGVLAVLQTLVEETNGDRRMALLSAAAQMGPLVHGPLLALLDTEKAGLQADVAELLRRLRVPQAVPLLLSNSASGERALIDAIEQYRRGTPPFAADASDQVEFWRLCPGDKLIVGLVPSDDVRIIWMAQLAQLRSLIRPENPDYLREAMVLTLQANAILSWAFERGGQPYCPQPQSESFVRRLYTADIGLLNELMAEALEAKYSYAAVVIANELGNRRDPQILYTADSKPSPLAAALRDGNRAVRFAALEAIMAIDPKSPYPGSSRVPDALAWFAAGTGERPAIVAMRTAVAATNLAGMLAAQNVRAEATDHGREAVDLALAMSDLEMIFVDINIDGLGIRQVLYELRTSPTTVEIPIALVAPSNRLAAAERLAAEHQRVIETPRPYSAEVVARLVEQLTTLSGRFAVPADVRAAEAVEAVTWLSRLTSGERPFYKIRRAEPVIEAALYGTAAAQPAIAALGRLGAPESQRALVDFASQPTLSIASRSQAANAFRESVAAHGLLLTSDEILNQYDRYNASELSDADTQRVLGSLLDSIESRRNVEAPLPLPPPP